MWALKAPLVSEYAHEHTNTPLYELWLFSYTTEQTRQFLTLFFFTSGAATAPPAAPPAVAAPKAPVSKEQKEAEEAELKKKEEEEKARKEKAAAAAAAEEVDYTKIPVEVFFNLFFKVLFLLITNHHLKGVR